MKRNRLNSFAAGIIIFGSCTSGQPQKAKTSLSAIEFGEKMKEIPTASIIDVRTPEEFRKGHLQNAINIDWNGREFDTRIAANNKSKPVLVYCLSGGRSSEAAKKMRAEGFKEVYELNGGMMKWRGANLPETTDYGTAPIGLTRQQFDLLLHSDKLVLIDFYADWCGPCREMRPSLDEISKEMASHVVVIRINTDDNPILCKDLKIDAIPVLQLYENKLLTWTNSGYLDKADIVKQLQ